MNRRGLWTALLLAVAQVPRPVTAHTRHPSEGRLRLADEEADLHLRVPLDVLALAIPTAGWGQAIHSAESPSILESAWTDYLSLHLSLERNGIPCRLRPSPLHFPQPEWAEARIRFDCASSGDWRLFFSAFPEADADHSLLLRVVWPEGSDSAFLLSGRQPDLVLSDGTRNAAGVAAGFFVHGLGHILSGPDHVLFVLGILLACGAHRRSLLWAVSGFTLAHTATLAMASSGSIRVADGVVEPLIGASIAYVGLEAVVRASNPVGWPIPFIGFHALFLVGIAVGGFSFPWIGAVGLLVFSIGYSGWMHHQDRKGTRIHDVLFPTFFGLAHGLGFAGPLLELRFSPGRKGWALAGFNLGVEAGQLAVLAVALSIAAFVKSTAVRPWPAWRSAAGLTLVAVGTIWMVERSL